MNKNFSVIVNGSIVVVIIISFAAIFLVVKNRQTTKIDAVKIYRKNFLLESGRVYSRFREVDNLNYLIRHDPTITNSLYRHKQAQTPTQIAKLITNKILANIAQINHVNAAYLIDEEGECIFSSRKDFIGKNYGFRPYFTESLKKDFSVYFARGITSEQVGIYFAHSIKLNGEMLGVAVIKIDPAFLDVRTSFSFSTLSPNEKILSVGLVTHQGVFLNALQSALYSIELLSDQHIKKIRKNNIAVVDTLTSLGFPSGTLREAMGKGFLKQSVAGEEYSFFTEPLGDTGLFFVHIAQSKWLFHEYNPVSPVFIGLLLVFGCLVLVTSMLVYLLNQRHVLVMRQSQSLIESENKLRLFSKAVEQSGHSIFITDAQANILYSNPHFTEVTGYSRDEVYGKNPRMLKSGKIDESTYVDLWKTLKERKTWKGVLHNKKKNGNMYWEEATISPITKSNGVVSHYIAIKEDISDRIALAQQLKEETEKLTLVVEHAGLGMAIIVEHRFTWINQSGANLFGYNKDDDILGVKSLEIFPDEKIYSDFITLSIAMFQRREIFKKEAQLRRKDGTLFWGAITGRPLDSEQPQLGAIWIVEDITKRKIEEKELYQAKKQAESANVMKSRMLANISHDIRTPLHGVIGTFSLLRETQLDAKQLKMVTDGLDASDYLLSLLNTLLDLSKIEAGQLIIDEHFFDIRTIFAELENIFSSQFIDNQIEFSCHISENIPEILIGDSLRIRQILSNLIGNSVKFTQQGTLYVSAQGGIEGDKFKMVCHVQDSGIGIPKEKYEIIFNGFTQVDNSISRKYGGTGLGLSISKELCHLMGGRIWFESVPGKGTTFSFTVLCDVHSGQEVEKREKVSVKESRNHPLTVLVVEDNETNRDILQMMLEFDGCGVTVASNGHTALEQLVENTFDLILMDMQMPVMDGLTATKIIRLCEADAINDFNNYPELVPKLQKALSGTCTPIIALTANAMEEDKQHCQAAGMDSFLIKPFSRDQLQQVLSKYPKMASSGRQYHSNPLRETTEISLQSIKEYFQTNYSFSADKIDILITTSMASIAQDLVALSALLQTDVINFRDTANIAHKIKGTMLSLGLYQLSKKMERIEQAAKKEEHQPYSKWLTKIEKAMKGISSDFGN